MKLFQFASVVLADWEQPSYWNAVSSVRQRKSGWGFPVGVRAAADWTLCPEFDLPDGVDSVTCDGSTCMQVCKAGKQGMGQRRVRCRHNRNKGFYWNRVSEAFVNPTLTFINVGAFCVRWLYTR